MESFKVGSKWKGFFDAPFPYGRQEFTCNVEELTKDCKFVAAGYDKEGNFTVKGLLTNVNHVSEENEDDDICDISFIKDYLTKDGYKGIKYKGKLTGRRINGNYSFDWKKSFISKKVSGVFEMNLVSS